MPAQLKSRARTLWIEPPTAGANWGLEPDALGLLPEQLTLVSSSDGLRLALEGGPFDLCVLLGVPPDLTETELWSRLEAHDPKLRVVIVADPSFARRRQQERETEAMRKLAAGVAHDLNNMLGVIASYATVMIEELDEADPRRDDAAQILGASERGRATTDQMLAFSRRRPVLPEIIELSARLGSRRDALARQLGETVQLETSLVPGLFVKLDPSQLDLALIQLVLNANDAMPNGGTLKLEAEMTRVESRRTCESGALSPGAYVRVSLIDDGKGMSPEVSSRVFEPFFSHGRGDKGRGLGLNVVQGFVEGTGGAIEIESALGQGTAVRLYLPAWTPSA